MLAIPVSGGETVPLDLDDYYIEENWQGWDDALHFRLPAGHPQRKQLQERLTITDQETGQKYNVVTIDEGRTSADITALLDLDELCSTMLLNYTNGSDTVYGTVSKVLPAGWAVIDNSGLTCRRTIQLDGARPLDVIQSCTKTYDGLAVRFDNAAKTVWLYFPGNEKPSGTYFTDELNLTEPPQYKGKAKDFYTRLYAQGKGGMTFADINGGKPYVDCFDYTDRVICRFWKDERYTDPESLLQAAQAAVKAAAVPERSYECAVVDLAQIDPQQFSFLKIKMYQSVLLFDRQTNARVPHQVARYRRYPYHPEKNKVILSTVPGTVSSRAAEVHAAVEDTAGTTQFSQRWSALIYAMADEISGYDGGNMIISKNSNGKPNGIMIMDTEDKATAQKILWLNLKGILYSDKGLAGFDNPDISKITVWSFEKNGFVADWLKAGTIDAALVKVINLVADRLKSTNGIYSLEAWAAVLSFVAQDFSRAWLFVSKPDSGKVEDSTGVLRLFSGKTTKSGALEDENARTTDVTADYIWLGRDRSNHFNGEVRTGTVRSDSDIICNGWLYVNPTGGENETVISGNTVWIGKNSDTSSTGALRCGEVQCDQIYCSNALSFQGARVFWKDITDQNGNVVTVLAKG